MDQKTHLVYEFGDFQLDPGQRILVRNGMPVALTPKAFETLLLLVQNSARVLEKEEMLKALWPESFVEEGNLSQNIFILRKTLGDDHNGDSFIQTIPRRGYRFVSLVKERHAAILDNGAQSSLAADYWSQHSPFRGLQVFETEDAWLFFGRDSETDDLLARLARSAVLAIVGNSGSGKSSLIRAGLIAALRCGRFQQDGMPIDQWRIAVFRPSGSPFDYLADILPSQLAPELSLKEQADFIAYCRNTLPSGSDTLRNAILALANTTAEGTGRTHILLVADQFEEIFTLTTDQKTRNQYIDCLLAASRMDSAVPVHLVLALRADFYAHCLEHSELSRCLENNLYNVPRMTGAQLRETIEKRLQLAAAQAESGVIDALLEEIGTEPGDLALLEHALDQLWEKCGGYGCTLTNQAYSEIGRLRGALGRHADGVYAGLGDESRKELAQKIFLELVHVGEGAQDTRRRVQKENLLCLGPAEEVEQLLGRLTSARLVSTGGEGRGAFVEVSHEALIRQWPALREWIAQNREDLSLERRLLPAAEEWEELDRDPGALLRGARLTQGEEWLARHLDASPLLREYVQASVTARLQAERREREAQERELSQQKTAAVRLRWLTCALTVLLLGGLGSAWYAHHRQVLEKSRSLAAQAEELLSRDPGQALHFAIDGWRLARTEESHVALASAFPEPLATLRHEASLKSAMFSSDGQRIVTASDDSTARLWNSADGKLLAALQGHTREISHAEFSPDGTRVVTASYDQTARIWSGRDGHLLAVLQGHGDKLDWATFSPDGSRVLTASRDHTTRVWNAADGRLLTVLQGHAAEVTRAQFSPDGKAIVTASNDRTARVWNSDDGHLLTTLSGHTAEVRYADFFPDNQRIITTSGDGTARIWSRHDGRLLFVLHHDGPVEHATFSPNGSFVVTASYDHTARVWDGADGKPLLVLQHDGPVQHAAFSPDGQYIVTASNDHTARVWNGRNGNLLAILQGHAEPVYYAGFSISGDRIVTCSGDHTARVWNIAAGLSLAALQGHGGYVMDAEFSPDGQRIVTASKDHTARIWSSADGRPLAIMQGHTDEVRRAEFSPDGKRIVTASKDGTARIWRAADGRLLALLQGHTDEVRRAEFSPDGQRVVTASMDHTARIWSASDGRLLATLLGHTGGVWRAEFSPDGQRIVTASRDHTARVWSAINGSLVTILQGHNEEVGMATFSPDGQRIVTASNDHTARVWSAVDGRLLTTLEGHTNSVWIARFSPDGQRIVTAGIDHTARIWNAADGRQLTILQGHTGQIGDAMFSPDGQRILTAGDDHTARVWSSADGRLLAVLQGHSAEVGTASFSPDGQRIVTASYDQTARVWRVVTLRDVDAILAK